MTNNALGGSAPRALSFKGAHFPQDIILMGVRWYLASPLSTRHVEELLEKGPIDHATVQRGVVQYRPQLEAAFHRRQRPVWVSWRMDETYSKVKGHGYDLDRAVDKTGQTIACLRTEQRDEETALRLLKQAMRRHSVPEKIPMDGRAAMQRPSSATTRSTAPRSSSARASIATILSTRISAACSGSPGPW